MASRVAPELSPEDPLLDAIFGLVGLEEGVGEGGVLLVGGLVDKIDGGQPIGDGGLAQAIEGGIEGIVVGVVGPGADGAAEELVHGDGGQAGAKVGVGVDGRGKGPLHGKVVGADESVWEEGGVLHADGLHGGLALEAGAKHGGELARGGERGEVLPVGIDVVRAGLAGGGAEIAVGFEMVGAGALLDVGGGVAELIGSEAPARVGVVGGVGVEGTVKVVVGGGGGGLGVGAVGHAPQRELGLVGDEGGLVEAGPQAEREEPEACSHGGGWMARAV